MRLPGERMAAWVVDGPAPCVMLAGVLRPRLVISRGVVAALSAEQLSAAIRHERAHGISRDNLKRLLVLLAPGILPFVPDIEIWSGPGRRLRSGPRTIARRLEKLAPPSLWRRRCAGGAPGFGGLDAGTGHVADGRRRRPVRACRPSARSRSPDAGAPVTSRF